MLICWLLYNCKIPIILGIRTSSQIFESNKVIESVEEDEFDYYDYYDNYEEDDNRSSEEAFRNTDPNPPQQPQIKFSSSTFPPPDERFAAIDQNDVNSFRLRIHVSSY